MRVKHYVRLLRPRQWLKNLILYFPPFLGGMLLKSGVALSGFRPFAAFCLASSSIYILNDLCDRESDALHPKKRLRPLPSGKVTPGAASALALVCVFFSGLLSWKCPAPFSWYLLTYGGVSVAYSLALKHLVLVDIFCISICFLIRLLAGGAFFGITISEWLFLSVFLLSVFLSVGKRYSEKEKLGSMAVEHRKTLDAYPAEFLQSAMNLTGAAVLVTYTMYVLSRPPGHLLYTVPLCCFGLLRYLLRIQSGGGGDPTESLTRDGVLFVVGALWAAMVGWGIYVP